MAFGSAVNSSHVDANQNPSQIGVIGTLGTSDTQGTALTLPIAVDPTTGAVYQKEIGTPQFILSGGTLQSGTIGNINSIGTVGTLQLGSVQVIGGTFNAGTFSNAGTNVNIVSGSSVGTILGGTIQNLVSGTLNAITTITSLTNGSVTMQVGTLTTGTLQNLVSGTINALASGTITTGTISVTAGTLSPLPTIANSPFGTIGTTGASVFGTLAGGTSSGAGTEIFITSLSLSIPSTAGSQDVSIGWGTNGGTFHAGTGRLVRGNFLAGGGIQKTFYPPVNSGTNAQLTYFQAGAGTCEIDITYFVTTSTL